MVFAVNVERQRVARRFKAARRREVGTDHTFRILLTVQVLDVESAGGTYNIRLFIEEKRCIVAPLHLGRNGVGKTGKPQQGRHDVRRGKHQVVHARLNLIGKTHQERNVHGLGVRGILRVFRMLATHGLSMVGGKHDNGILVQPEFLQGIKYLTESTVDTRHRSKVVACTLCLEHLGVGIRTDEQAVQRLVFIEIEIFLHTVVQRTVRTMGRIHAYHNEERFLRVAYIPLVLQIRHHLARFV